MGISMSASMIGLDADLPIDADRVVLEGSA